MRVLITGCAGFIGNHLSERLLERGDTVIGVDYLTDQPGSEHKQRNLQVSLASPNFKFYDKDIRELKELDWLFFKHKPEIVIHLGAKAGVRESLSNPELYKTINIEGTRNLLELAVKYAVKNFVFASSSSVYGTNTKVPFSESDPIENIVSPYAQTKEDGEIICRQYHDKHGLNIVMLRFFTVYGPRGSPNMAPFKFVDLISKGEPIQVYILEKEFNKGMMARDFTFVSDIVDGIVLCLDKQFGVATFNLGRGEPVKLNEFIAVVEKCVGRKAVKQFVGRQEGDVPITFADISKARKYLGYEPKVSVEEGVKQLVEWYKGVYH